MTFQKTAKQEQAVPILSKSRHAACYGGSRSGKTFIIIYAIIVRACKCKSRHAIFRKTFSSVKRSIWMDTLPKVMSICFPHLKYKPNKSDFFIPLPNGSEIWVCGLDDGDRVEKILGMEFSTLYFNEASEILYDSIQIVTTRLAEKNALRKRIYYDFNPPKKSHWSYSVFILKIDPEELEPIAKPEDYSYILMNPQDNMENIDEEYLAILEAMPEKKRARFLLGEFDDDNEGNAYYEFKRDTHVDANVSKKAGTIHIGMDFNVHPFTGVIASYVNGELHIFDELYLENSDTPRASKWLRDKGYLGIIYPDSTGKNRKTSGKSDFQMLRDDGHQVKYVTNPIQYDRVNNINRLFKEGKIKINPRCKKLIADLESVAWKNQKLDEGPTKMLTHISDALGYLAWNLLPFSGKLKEISHSQRR